MTDRERAIVETYTGICMLTGNKRNEVYKYMEEIMGRPVFTHELADKQIQQELMEKAKPDFLKLCTDQINEHKPRKEYKKIYLCGDCGFYNWKKHKCSRGATKEGTATDKFYKDCPLPGGEETEEKEADNGNT